MSLLSIQNIDMQRGTSPVLKQLCLEVGENEIVGIVGPSGCGKTSLLYAVAGLLPVNSGSLFWRGNNLEPTPVHKRNFGFVFQEHLLFPHKNVAENISFGLKMAGWEKLQIKARVEELLYILKLEEMGGRSVQSLSGGQAQRVSLGRALAPRPGLLLLDEPLAALDQTLRDSLSEEIRNIIKEQKIPAIYVSHDLREMSFVADRLGLMKDGKIHSTGAPGFLRNNPQDSYTANFFGLSNQFEVELTQSAVLICPWGELEQASAGSIFDAKQAGRYKILILPEDIAIFQAAENSPANDETRLISMEKANTEDNLHNFPQTMPPNLLKAEIMDSRFLGSEYLVKLQLSACGSNLTASVKFEMKAGTMCYIQLDLSRFILLEDNP